MSFDIFPLGNGKKPFFRPWEEKVTNDGDNHRKSRPQRPTTIREATTAIPTEEATVSDGPMNAAPELDKDFDTALIEEKLSLDQSEWPKICISLSRKEKEDDFLAMRGSKLPQRPKKRAKYIDKSLQYCFPGMWLSDLTRGRYEVREKRCNKKRRMGLKGMESIESDSE